MRHWFVVVAVPGHIYTAAEEIFGIGAEVFLPEDRSKVRLATGGSGIVVKPLIDPYLFARFDGNRDEECAAIKACRGVEDILGTFSAGRRMPQWIAESVILDFQARHYQTMRGLTVRTRRGRTDLKLMEQYRILRHESFQGQEGKLLAAERGIAHMRVGPFLVSLPDSDIAPMPAPVQAKRAA